MQAFFSLLSQCLHILTFKFKEPPSTVPLCKKIRKGMGGGVLLNSGWGNTVHLRIALWEEKGMGEMHETCRDLLALL